MADLKRDISDATKNRKANRCELLAIPKLNHDGEVS